MAIGLQLIVDLLCGITPQTQSRTIQFWLMCEQASKAWESGCKDHFVCHEWPPMWRLYGKWFVNELMPDAPRHGYRWRSPACGVHSLTAKCSRQLHFHSLQRVPNLVLLLLRCSFMPSILEGSFLLLQMLNCRGIWVPLQIQTAMHQSEELNRVCLINAN